MNEEVVIILDGKTKIAFKSVDELANWIAQLWEDWA